MFLRFDVSFCPDPWASVSKILTYGLILPSGVDTVCDNTLAEQIVDSILRLAPCLTSNLLRTVIVGGKAAFKRQASGNKIKPALWFENTKGLGQVKQTIFFKIYSGVLGT